jgi:hypothetical protein
MGLGRRHHCGRLPDTASWSATTVVNDFPLNDTFVFKYTIVKMSSLATLPVISFTLTELKHFPFTFDLTDAFPTPLVADAVRQLDKFEDILLEGC